MLLTEHFRDAESKKRVDEMTKRYADVKVTVTSLSASVAGFDNQQADMKSCVTSLSLLAQLQDKMQRLIADAAEVGADDTHVKSLDALIASAEQTISFCNQLLGESHALVSSAEQTISFCNQLLGESHALSWTYNVLLCLA